MVEVVSYLVVCEWVRVLGQGSSDPLRPQNGIWQQLDLGVSCVCGVSILLQNQAVKGEKKAEALHLDNSTKDEFYVCFKGLLGTHLKQEVREWIWRGEYIFLLLPVEWCNLDMARTDEKN